MTGEGRFIDSLSDGIETEIPGGVKAEGAIKGIANNKRFMRLDFDSVPAFKGKVLANGTTFANAAPTGAGGDENIMTFPEGTLEWHVLGTQTILAPVLIAAGLQVNQDATADDGIEICGGILACNKTSFVVGTDEAFYAKATFMITDITGTDDCAFGFHKVEAYQANIDDYDEMAVLNVISGNITIETILNAGTTSTTDTTNDWADLATHELEVRVSAAGVVTYKIDGVAPTTVAAFTFDDGEVVTPFFFMLNHTDLAGNIVFSNFECGPQ
jgi:hypothetical protein